MRTMKTLSLWSAIAVIIMMMSLHAMATLDDLRTADAILADLDSAKPPVWDDTKQDDENYRQEYSKQYQSMRDRRSTLTLELLTLDPTHAKLVELLPERWQNMQWQSEESKAKVLKEIDAAIERDPKGKLAGEGRYLKAQFTIQDQLWSERKDLDKALEAAETFIKTMPGDDRGARLLSMVADSLENGSERQIAIYERIKKDYPNSGAAKYAGGKIRQATGAGKPFELSFNDVVTGKTIDMNDLHGKVVVIDFWATWCGPCVGEMPHMKELYKKHHDAGLEVIGVSLDMPEDQGGLDKLKNYLAKEEIAWPNYYQGKGWDSEFSTSWGINGIPTMFVIDKKGNLRETEGRGKLDELVPKLLAE